MPERKTVTKIKPKHFLWGAFLSGCTVILIAWLFAPSVISWGLRYLASEAQISKFEIEVKNLDPWETRMEDIFLENEEANLSIGSLFLQYEPERLAMGNIHSLTVRNLDLKLDGKEILNEILDLDTQEVEASDEQWLERVSVFLSDPRLTHLRIFDSKVALEWRDFSLPLVFKIKGDYSSGIARTIFDGEFSGFPFLSEIRFWEEDGNTFTDMEIEFSDLNKIGNLKYPISRLAGVEIGTEFSIQKGDLVMQGIGRIEGNNVKDLFFEFNGSNIAGELFDFEFSIEKAISFLSPDDLGGIDFRTYANFSVNDFVDLKGVALGLEKDGQSLSIRSSIQEMKTSEIFGKLKISGLSLPVLDLNLSEIENLPLHEPHDIFFKQIELEDSLNLGEGSINIFLNQDMNLFRIHVPPLNAILSELNVRLFGLSFNGLFDPNEFLGADFIQVLSCERALLGEDSLVENLSIGFRPQGEKQIFVDNITAKLKGILADISPANCTVTFLEGTEAAYRIDFNNTDVRFGRDGFELEGLTGSVSIISFDPLITAPKNDLSFRKFTFQELVLEDGSFSFSVNDEGEFIVFDFFVEIFDGSMEIESAKWKIYTDFVKLDSLLTDVSGQEIVDFFEGMDLQIDGNFSGRFSFSNYGGVWDFGTGFLQLNPSDTAHIKFSQGNLIYQGIDPNDPEAKNLKLTAWALEDLEVDGMRVNFKVLENERQIMMSIKGLRETEDQKVDLDYNPKFIGGLQDLLRWKENIEIP